MASGIPADTNGARPAHAPHPSLRQIALFLLAALLLLFARAPRLLLEGRIYAEEGTTYLRYAWDATPWHALLAPHQGYYSLLDNATALIAARLLPLSAAALLFTWIAAAIQLLLIYLAVECEIFSTQQQRWLALFALLLVTPNLEAWLSLENCQSLFAVAAAVILISSTGRLFALRAATLILGALTSVNTAPLIPLFWLRAWRQRSRRAFCLALCITLPVCMQAAVLLHAMRAGDRPSHAHELRSLAAYTTSRVLVLPFATWRGADAYDTFLYAHPGLLWTGALYLASTTALILGFLLFRSSSRAALLLYAAALLSGVFNWYGCLRCSYPQLLVSRGAEGRYFFPANAMLLLALLITSTRASPRWVARAATVAFAWLLATGVFYYIRMRAYLEDYPAWTPQIRQWQVDERQTILIAPYFWRQNQLHLDHRHPNRADLPANAYDSLSHHSPRE